MVQRSIRALAAFLLLSTGAFANQSFVVRPGITRGINSGTTDTATLGDLAGQISWQSSSAAPKTQTLPGCNTLIDGMLIGVTDGIGTAATYPITVNAASGTVGGSSGGLPIVGNFQGLVFACQGGQTNWTVIGTAPGAGAITWPNLNAETTCSITGVGSSPTIFTPTCAVNLITIANSTSQIAIPSNMPGSGAMVGRTLDITYSGSVTPPTFGTGTQWANKTPPPACGGSVTSNCLSGVSGAHDRIIGQSLDASDILYGAVLTNYGAPPTRAFVRGSVASSTTGTSVTLTLSGAGGSYAICATLTSSSMTTISVTETGGSDTFTGFDGLTIGTHELKLWRANIAGTPTAFTANFSGSTAGKIRCDIFNGISAIVAGGAGFNSQAPASGTGANTITSNAITSTAGHLLYGINYVSSTATVSAGTSPNAFTLATADATGASYIISAEFILSAPGGSVSCTFGNSTLDNFYTDCIDFN